MPETYVCVPAHFLLLACVSSMPPSGGVCCRSFIRWYRNILVGNSFGGDSLSIFRFIDVSPKIIKQILSMRNHFTLHVLIMYLPN